jgi:hypothetical protein
VHTHSAVAILVAEIKSERALVPAGVCRMVRTFRRAFLLTGGSLVTDGRVTQVFRKRQMRSNNSNDGNYLLLRGILSKLMSSNVL